MKTWLLCLAVGICSALPEELGVAETYAVLEYPEEVPGLFEGDIELQPGEDPTHKNVVGDRRKLWPNAVIPFEIESSYPKTVQTIFQDAMNEIETKTKVNGKTCIDFRPRHGETAYMIFGHGTGCHTPIGNTHHKCQVTIGHGCERKGTVMHEILHGLGFYHEQSRHDRDTYVTIHLDNVQSGHEHNFNKYEIPKIDELGQPYDYGSIMHYGMYSFAKDRSKPTIEPKKSGVSIGQRVRLSDIDVKELQILYGCIQGPNTHGGSGGFVTAPPATTAAPPSGSDVCTFSSGICDWTQSHSDSTDWVTHHGPTSTQHTGPDVDPHGSGTANYLYVEATGHHNQIAKIHSKPYPDGDYCVNFYYCSCHITNYLYVKATGHHNQIAKIHSKPYPGGDYCVNFYYHMYGSAEGSLYLNAITSGTHVHHLKSWSGDHANRWHHYKLHARMHTSHTFTFEFEARIGSGDLGDIAIDDVIIHPGSC